MIAEPPPPEPAPVARPVWLIALAVALALGLVVTVGYTGWAVAQRVTAVQQASGDAPVNDALTAAESCFTSVFSYDYRSYDESVAAGLECTTGGFRAEYLKTTRSLKATAIREKAVVRATVQQVGVMEATPRRVQVLAYVNQRRRNVNISGEKLDQNRVTATLVLTRGEWRLVEARAI